MKLYDTARRGYAEFKPGRLVGIYVCGITPYDTSHLGHIVTFMTYDLLIRRLEDLGHEVRLVRNITDVDEPIYKKAQELGVDYKELAKNETSSFQKILEVLNFKKAYNEPLASDYIEEMAGAVKELSEGGFAYRVDEDIYFDTQKVNEFKRFSGYSDKLLDSLSAMRGGDPGRSGKKHPLDFLLWKHVADPADPAQWKTAVGTGRPGWHIECSIMSSQLLGLPFDIHGGGNDLIFPHHSAEIAQNIGMGHQDTAGIWLHVAPILWDGEKMSKSLGNLVYASDLLKTYEPSVIRLALMSYHHRVGGEWQPELLGQSQELLDQVRSKASTSSLQDARTLHESVRRALDDDINTPEVISALKRFIHAVPDTQASGSSAEVIETLNLLGLSPGLNV